MDWVQMYFQIKVVFAILLAVGMIATVVWVIVSERKGGE